MTDDDADRCPVCSEREPHETFGAYGIVQAGAKALVHGDWEKVKDLYSTLTPYDAHIAITFYALALTDLCEVTGGDIDATLDYYQETVRAALAEER